MLGVDIGGTGVRAARVDGARVTTDVHRAELEHRSVDEVVQAVAGLHDRLGGSRVGVGVPGFVTPHGVVVASPNFPTWNAVPLAELLAEATGVPASVGNDANLAALGVWRARGGHEDLILLTLGTGVGGAVILDGRPLTGRGGTAAELGHIHVGGDRVCGCGGRGCLEMWCGTVGLIAAARERGREVQAGAEVVDAAAAGDGWALEVFEEAAIHLGKGLVTLVNTFAPEVVVIGGGLTAARPFLAPAEDYLRAFGVPPSTASVQIVWEGPVDSFAIRGAVEWARRP